MPPLRRYLRISPHSVLETRIYLDNPTDLHRWLLSPASPALPRVIEAVRPLVLPKLREENDIAKGKGKGKSKGKRKSGVKDTVTTGRQPPRPYKCPRPKACPLQARAMLRFLHVQTNH